MLKLVAARRQSFRAMLVLATAAVALSVAPRADAITSYEQSLAKYINQARSSRGIRTMSLASSVSDVARAHSARMANAGRLYHTPDLERALSRWTWWRVAGENVGRGPTMSSIYRAFMQSSSHKANILYRSYKVMGVGVVWKDGIAYVTVMFMG